MLSIKFDNNKFTSENFERIIDKYWDKSSKDQNIEFDLSNLEWIANEQIAFLFGWIKSLLALKISIAVIYPKQHENTQTNNKRLIATRKLILDWNISGIFGDSITHIRGLNVPGDPNFNPKFNPFRHRYYSSNTFDNDFDQLYNTDLKLLNEYIEDSFSKINESNYFNSAHISYSLLKELLSNSYQHAYQVDEDDDEYKPIFLSLDFNTKIDTNKYSKAVLEQKLSERYVERPTEEREYFKNGNSYINNNLLEFSFFDFGNPIGNTLKENFNKEQKEIKDQLESVKIGASIETQILEYAFQTWSSRFSIEESLEIHNYIPRGLFIVKEIVKKFGGALIIRSGKGKMVFDLKDNNEIIRFRPKNVEDKIKIGFPGTIFTIVLPTNPKTKFSEVRNLFDVNYLHSAKIKIQLLKRLEESKLQSTGNFSNNSTKEILQNFFGGIWNILRNNSQNKVIYFLDFAGITKNTHDIFEKIIYFLSYSPLITEKQRILFYNIDEELEMNFSSMRTKGFEAFPIIYIQPNFRVNYVGTIKNIENIIQSVWLNKTEKSKSLIEIVAQEIVKFNQESIDEEVQNKGIQFKELIDDRNNYNDVKIQSKKNEIYLISTDTYANEYLRFIEKIYIISYRKLISLYLFSKYLYSKLQKFEDNLSIEAFWDEKDNVNAILSVTLGSELIAKELKELFEKYLTTSTIKRIPLTTYFDFDDDETYSAVNCTDKIIILNDFISSGKFTEKLVHKITGIREGERVTKIKAILSIADCRDNSQTSELKILSISKYPIKKQDGIKKETIPIFVNPVLNNPQYKVQEINPNILIKNTDFLYDSELLKLLPDEYFLIGNFKLNFSYHTHFVKTKEIFSQEVIFQYIIKKLISVLNARENNFEETISSIKTRLSVFFTDKTKFEKQIKEIESTYKDLFAKQGNLFNKQITTQKSSYHFDYIFYPFDSPIGEIEDVGIFKKIKQTGKLGEFNVDAVPRILTPQGWRFSNPPQYLRINSNNHPCKILIIDDGSCSGNTVEQMILSLNGLNIQEIIVLSFISRLEDFRLDFLTKIRQISLGEHIIPINIYYATHFNINAFSKGFHPLDNLNSSIERIKEKYQDSEIPEYLTTFFEYLDLEYKNPLQSLENEDKLNHFPKIIKGFTISAKASYLIRSYLGQYLTFKTTKYDPNDTTIQTQSIVDYMEQGIDNHKNPRFYTTLATLFHEPKLIHILKRIHPNTYKKFENKVFQEFTNPENNQNDLFIFCYLAYNFNSRRFFESREIKDFIIEKLSRIEGSVKIFDLLGFLLTEDIILKKHKDYIKSLAIAFIVDTFFEINEKYANVQNEISKNTNINNYENVLSYFKNFQTQLVIFNSNSADETINIINKIRTFFLYEITHLNKHQYLQKQDLLNRIILLCQNTDLEETIIKSKIGDILNEFFDTNTKEAIDLIQNFIPRLEERKKKFTSDQIKELRQVVHDFQDLHKKIDSDNVNFKLVKSKVEAFSTKIMNPRSDFFDFVTKTKVNIVDVWKEATSNYPNSDDYNLIIEKHDNQTDFDINFDQFSLQSVFRSIIDNRNLYAKDAKIQYSIKKKTEAKRIIMTFKQEQEFKKATNTSGSINIKTILSEYHAEYRRLSTSPDFIFTIEFLMIQKHE